MRRRYTKPRPKREFKPRANHQIRVPQVQVIDAAGTQLGTMDTSQALELAMQASLDLVEISPTTKPPVTKIMDYGKYLYDLGKKKKAAKQQGKAAAANEIKTVRITFKAGTHDLEVRAKQADAFMAKGHRVKVEMKLRGRERGMKKLAVEKMKQFLTILTTAHQAEDAIKPSPAGLTLLVTPEKK